MTIKTHDGLKLVPWESWQQWNHVREAVFSSSPTRVSAALSKIAAWRARGSLPVAVEVTGDLISIHSRDPFFSSDLCSEKNPVTDEMLRLMYATAIMRLVNGVVDQSKKLNSASVAVRAKVAGLPRILVDIRHEVAHKEIPSASYLRLASKQALDWLKAQYWEAQKQVLDDVHKHLREKLYTHASLIDKSHLPQSEPLPDSKMENCSEKELAKLVSAAIPDVVSILQIDGILEECASGKGVWRYIVSKLCSRVPELLKEIVSWCIEGKAGDLSRIEFTNHLIGFAHDKELTHYVAALAKFRGPRLNILSECNNTNDLGVTVSVKESARAANDECINCCNIEDDSEFEFKRMELSLSEAMERMQCLRKHSGTALGSNGKWNHDEHNKNPLSKAAWSIPDHWRPCAIGMLPSVWHSTGILPSFESMFVDSERQATPCHFRSQSRTECEGDGASVALEVKVPQVDIASTKQKRNFSENMTETATKRIKPETAVRTDQSKCFRMELDVESDANVASEAKQNNSQLSGFLLLDGLYQRCGSEQIAAIQAEIKVFE